MIKKEATNTFLDGLLMDLNPITTPNSTLTHCLNGTIITYNGNEHVLLNDMGNGRVETACLPLGYIPLGTAELGGIIYIASYNPLTGKSLIGSFPSPERNVSSDKEELSPTLSLSKFYDEKDDNAVITDTVKIELTEDLLRIGDKFLVASGNIDDHSNILSAYGDNTNNDPNCNPRLLKLHLVSILEDGKIVYLDDNLTWYSNNNGTYFIKKGSIYENSTTETLVDEYRGTVTANYSVFSSKIPGKLAIVALLEAIENFSVSTNIYKDGYDLTLNFNTNWTYTNANPNECGDINPTSLYIDATVKPKSGSESGPKTLSFKDSILGRNNNGTDSDVVSEDLEISTTDDTTFVNLTIYPLMSYGYLQYLGIPISINVKKLNTGETTLNEFRYYVEDEFMTLSYGFDSYPEEGKAVKEVTFNFYEFNDNVYDIIKDTYKYDNKDTGLYYTEITDYIATDIFSEKTNIESTTYSFKNTSSSMLGHFSEKIYYDENATYGLKKNNCYVVKVAIKYGKKNSDAEDDNGSRYYYRILYTNKVFNSAYYTSVEDFSTLNLSNYIDVTLDTSVLSSSGATHTRSYVEGSPDITDLENITDLGNLPLTKETLSQVKYTIIDKFEETETVVVTPALSITEIFSAKVNWSDIDKKEEPIQENNAINQYITVTETIEDIEFKGDSKIEDSEDSEDSGSKTFTIKNNHTYKIPIWVDYSNQEYSSVAYLLKELTNEIYYFNIWGEDKKTDLGLSLNITSPESSSYYYAKAVGDKEHSTFTSFATIPNINSGIRSALTNTDVIVIIATIYYFQKGSPLIFEYHDHLTDTAYNGYNHSNGTNVDGGSWQYCFVFLAIKNENSSFDIIAPKEGDWALGNEASGDSITNDSTGPKLYKISNVVSAIKSQLKGTYKLQSYSGNGIPLYTANNIVYKSNFTSTIETPLKLKNASVDFKINDVQTNASNASEDGKIKIKNLGYDIDLKEQDLTIPYTILRYINIELEVLKLQNPTLISSNSVYYDDGGTSTFIEGNITSKLNLYLINNEGSKKELVETYNLSTVLSSLLVSNSNDEIILDNNTTTDGYKFYVRTEQQKFTIENIKGIKGIQSST